jgi:hypothetical protein
VVVVVSSKTAYGKSPKAAFWPRKTPSFFFKYFVAFAFSLVGYGRAFPGSAIGFSRN